MYENPSFTLPFTAATQLVLAQQNFTWSAYPGNAASKTFILDGAWSGTVTVTAYAAAGGRILSTLVQPTSVKTGTTLVVSVSAFATRTLSGSTYLEIALGGIVRFKGYLTISYSTTSPGSGTVVSGGGSGGSSPISSASITDFVSAVRALFTAGTNVSISNEGVISASGSGSSTWSGLTGQAPNVSTFPNNSQYQTLAQMNAAISAAIAGVSGATAYALEFDLIGESNAGGYANVSEATTAEKSARAGVMILRNDTYQFETLQIGVNNSIDLNQIDATKHGWELGIANAAVGGAFLDNPIYIVKAGQGGATRALWAINGTYWNKFSARVDSAKVRLQALGKTPLRVVVMSIGINDYLASMTPANYRTALTSYIKDVRSKLGYVPVIFPKFMSNYDTYNAQIDSVAKYDPFVFPVATASGNNDGIHWNYAGMKAIAASIVSTFLTKIGQRDNYRVAQINALGGLTVSGSSSSGGTTTGGTSATLGTASTYGTSTTGNPYTVATYYPQLNSKATSGAQSGTYWGNDAAGRAGAAVANGTVAAGAPFEVVMDLDDATSANNNLLFLDNTAADDYNGGTKNFTIGAIAVIGTAVYQWQDAFSLVKIGDTTFPAKVRLLRSGNDLLYSFSTNGGASWTSATGSGRLAGQTSMIIKVMNNNAAAGQKARVSFSK